MKKISSIIIILSYLVITNLVISFCSKRSEADPEVTADMSKSMQVDKSKRDTSSPGTELLKYQLRLSIFSCNFYRMLRRNPAVLPFVGSVSKCHRSRKIQKKFYRLRAIWQGRRSIRNNQPALQQCHETVGLRQWRCSEFFWLQERSLSSRGRSMDETKDWI